MSLHTQRGADESLFMRESSRARELLFIPVPGFFRNRCPSPQMSIPELWQVGSWGYDEVVRSRQFIEDRKRQIVDVLLILIIAPDGKKLVADKPSEHEHSG